MTDCKYISGTYYIIEVGAFKDDGRERMLEDRKGILEEWGS